MAYVRGPPFIGAVPDDDPCTLRGTLRPSAGRGCCVIPRDRLWIIQVSSTPQSLSKNLIALVAHASMALTTLLLKALGFASVVLVVQYVVTYWRSPLKKIPGPFLAKFSDLWRFCNHYGQTHIETQKELHKKYGDVVRLGPNTVSIADASLLKTIYSTRGTFLKVCDSLYMLHCAVLTDT